MKHGNTAFPHITTDLQPESKPHFQEFGTNEHTVRWHHLIQQYFDVNEEGPI